MSDAHSDGDGTPDGAEVATENDPTLFASHQAVRRVSTPRIPGSALSAGPESLPTEMPGAEFLSGEVVSLYTVEEEDLDFLQRWRNHPEVRVPLTDARPRNGGQMREFFEERVSSEDGVRLLACVSRDRAEPTEEVPEDADVVPVGEVALPWMQDDHGSAMLSYWLAVPHQGNGYVTEAVELLLEWAFAERRLAKV